MPDAVETYLRSLNTSDRARAAAFDAVYNMDDAAAEATLKALPFSDAVRAKLWDARSGTEPTVETPSTPPILSSRLSDPGLQAAFAAEDAKRNAVNTALWQAGPGRTIRGGKAIVAGPTMDDRMGGMADVVVGGGTTAAELFAPSVIRGILAAPLMATMSVAGGTGGAALAREGAERMGAGPGGQALAEVTGGAVGGMGGAAASRPVSRTVRRGLQGTAEYLYRKAGYADTPKAIQAQMAASATGGPRPERLAREVMARGISGQPVEAGAQFMQRLSVLEPRLQASAGRRMVPTLRNRDRIASTLDMLARDVEGLPYGSEVVPEVTALAAKIRASEAPLATDVLRAKRLLDSARLSSTYKLNPSLSAKQAELQRASDDLRAAFHRADPNLSKLLNEERVAIQGLEAMINKAVQQGKADIVQALDPMMAMAGGYAAGPVGLAAPLARRGLRSSSMLTNTGQRLYRMGGGETVPMPDVLPVPPSIAALPAGARQMPPAPDPSFARGAVAQPAISGRPRQLTAGRPAPVVVPTGVMPEEAAQIAPTAAAAVIQKLRSDQYRPTQGTDPFRMIPIYGGMPARGSAAAGAEAGGAGVVQMRPEDLAQTIARVTEAISRLPVGHPDRTALEAWIQQVQP